MEGGKVASMFEKGEKAGIKETGGGPKDCKDATKCPPGMELKTVCIKSIYKNCCKQCIPPGQPGDGLPSSVGKKSSAASAGAPSWKEVWQKNMARWRNAVGSVAETTGLSHAELSPADGNAIPYEDDVQIKHAEVTGVQFNDGQAENVVPLKTAPVPSEIANAAKESEGAMVDAAIKAAQKNKPSMPAAGGKGPGWKEVWQKNMAKWQSALSPVAKTAQAAVGLAGAQDAPTAGGEAYPEEEGVKKASAANAPFSDEHN